VRLHQTNDPGLVAGSHVNSQRACGPCFNVLGPPDSPVAGGG
jgi:hypothetical protein